MQLCTDVEQRTEIEFAPEWRTEQVLALARAAVDECMSDHLLLLADALEEAGCTDERILNHFGW